MHLPKQWKLKYTFLIIILLNAIISFGQPPPPPPAPTASLTAPTAGSTIKSPVIVTVVFSDTYSSGTAKLTFTNLSGSYSNTLTLVDGISSSTFSFTTTAISSATISSSTYPTLPDGIYNLDLSYQIGITTIAASTTSSVTIQTSTPSPAITFPFTEHVFSGTNATTFTYNLPSASLSGTTLLTLSPGGYTYPLPSSIGSNTYTITTAPPPDGTYTSTISYQDFLGNPVASTNVKIKIDRATLSPTLTTPANSQAYSRIIPVSLTLMEPYSTNTANLTFENTAGTYSNTLTLKDNILSQTFTFTNTDISSSPNIISASHTTLPDGLYNVTISYKDIYGNTMASATNTNIQIQTSTPTPTLSFPTTGYVFSGANSTTYTYNLPSAPLSSTATLTLSPGGYTYTMPSTVGSNTFTITTSAPPDGTYTSTISYQDFLGNPVASTYVLLTIDRTTLSPNLTTPANNQSYSKIIPVSITLNETYGSGTANLTFENTAGTYSNTLTLKDNILSQTFTFTNTDIRSCPNVTASTSTTLPDDLYNVTLSYQDIYLNPIASSTISNVRIQTSTPAPILTFPTTGHVFSATNSPTFTYNLPSAPLSSTATLTLSPGGYTYTMPSTVGSNTFTITTNTPPDGTYTSTISYQDFLGNPVSSLSTLNIKLKYTADKPTIVSPTSNALISNTIIYYDSLPELNKAGTKKLVISKNNVIVSTITLNDKLKDTIYFDTHHLNSSLPTGASNIGLDSLADGTYVLQLSYQDKYDNDAVSLYDTIDIDTSPFIGILSHTSNTVYGPFTETLTFNKPVAIISDRPIIANLINNTASATIGTLSPNTNKTIYTFSVTPLAQGSIQLQSPFIGTATDLYGNFSEIIAMDSIKYIDTTILLTPIITGNISFCEGDSITLTSSVANSYLWSTSDTSRSIVVKKTGTYSVKTTYNEHVKGISNNTSVISYPIPSAPTISRNSNNALVSSAGYGNSWYLAGASINDTNNIIKPSVAGLYSVKTIQHNCTSLISSTYYYFVTDIASISNTEYIKVSPNPFTTQFSIDYKINGGALINMELFDITSGNKIAYKENIRSGTTITTPSINSGLYLLILSTSDRKIIKQFKMVKL